MRLVLGGVGAKLRQIYATLSELYEPGRTTLVGHALSFATRTFEEASGAPAATIHIAPAVFRSEYLSPAIGPGRDISRAPRRTGLAPGQPRVRYLAPFAAARDRNLPRLVRATAARLAAASPADGVSALRRGRRPVPRSAARNLPRRGRPADRFHTRHGQSAGTGLLPSRCGCRESSRASRAAAHAIPGTATGQPTRDREARPLRAVLAHPDSLRSARASRRGRHLRPGTRRRNPPAHHADGLRPAG
jgi:hypothetical protein